MASISGVDQDKFLTVDTTYTFNIQGQGLDIVTTGTQVRLCTSKENGSKKKKFAWGIVTLPVKPTGTTINVQVFLKALDVPAKPTGAILGFFVWLWAAIRRLFLPDPTGDLTITITDSGGNVAAAKTVTGVTYPS
jgi:hypothetical protein